MAAAEAPADGGSGSFFSSLTSFFLPTAYAEEPAKDDGGDDEKEGGDKEEGDKDDGGEEKEDDEGEDKESGDDEEEEPEDPAPGIREECQDTACSEPAKHFKHCSERIEGGKGWHGEDCVEELFHLLHCVDSCAAPKIFRKLA